jgi:hypothetical protein
MDRQVMLCSNTRESRVQGVYVAPEAALLGLAGVVQRPALELPQWFDSPSEMVCPVDQEDARNSPAELDRL